LKSAENRKHFLRLHEILRGSKGIVYLMFLGRDTYTAMIRNSFVPAIFQNPENVDQTVKNLLKHGSELLIFRRKDRKEKRPGRKANIYTASFDPIFLTLRAFGIDFDKDEMQRVIKLLSPTNDYFPRYLQLLSHSCYS